MGLLAYIAQNLRAFMVNVRENEAGLNLGEIHSWRKQIKLLNAAPSPL